MIHLIIHRLYFTSVKLGTPATEFYVQIDTGSDVLWVGCNSCSGCPQSSGLKVNTHISFSPTWLRLDVLCSFFNVYHLVFIQIQLHSFEPQSSSTASVVSCSDKMCTLGLDTQDSSCDSQKKQCTYAFQYGDGSGASGYYVSDLLHFDTAADNQSVASNSSASIVFGWDKMCLPLRISNNNNSYTF